MDQQLSWSKAYIVSAALHIVLFLLLALGLAAVVAQQEQQVYVVDLQTSDFSQGSGHEGGGSSDSLFPEPLKAEEVAKRVETIQHTMPTPAIAETVTTPTQDTVSLPTQSTAAPTASPSTSTSTGSERGSSEGGGFGAGTGTGSGDGTGDGQGTGEGSGAGQGHGDGNVSGTGGAPFDANGFWAAVNANKEYPYMAMKRRLQGTTKIVTTIDASGNIVSVSIMSPSGHSILDEAAVAAARAVGHYPNPTGGTVTVETDVKFAIR